MSDGGFRGLKRCLYEFMKSPAFHEFHDNVTNDSLFFNLLKRVMKLNNVRLLSVPFGINDVHDPVPSLCEFLVPSLD